MDRELFFKNIFESSLTIDEKRKYYTDEAEVDERYLKEWKNKKNLVTEELFKTMLEKDSMNEREFNFCISPLKVENSFEFPQWLKLLDEILKSCDYKKIKDTENKDITFVIFPFIQYVAERISEFDWDNSLMEFTQSAIKDILDNYAQQTITIVEKCVVVELEEYKSTHKFVSEDLKLQFNEFIEYITEKENLLKFYEKYTVNTKIMTVRTMYFIKNIEDFVSDLKGSEQDMKDTLGLELSAIQHIKLSAGDSHEKGKGVMIVEFDKCKVVYKPKNLDICKAYEDFIKWINENSGMLDLTTPRGIYKESYAIIEFVKYKSCTSEDEVKRYYERFGYTLALGYTLAMTDIHLENVVADGEYPVIVDGETMIQNTIKVSKNNTIFDKFRNKFSMETVLATAMLPNTAMLDKNIDLSALAGKEQTSNRKFLMPVNLGKSNFHYEEQEYTMSGSNNIPMLNNKLIDYKDYIYCVINGFNKMIDFIYKNKEFLLSEKSPLMGFKDRKIRVLLKSTQIYGDMLGFLTHPTCCIEMSARERTLQNIWAYPHLDKDIIKSEYKDMLYNDIPIFYSSTSCDSLYDSEGNEYKKYFEKTGFHKVIERIRNLNEEIIEREKDIMLMHLGVFSQYKSTEFSRKDYTFNFKYLDLDCEIKEIADKIMNSALEDDKNNISWPFVAVGEKASIFGLMGNDLYEGVTGVAVFFLELYYYTKDESYYEFYKKCMLYCESGFDKVPNVIAAFSPRYSLFYPIMLETKLLGQSKFKDFIEKAVNELSKFSKNDIIEGKTFSIDWIGGIAGLLALLTSMFKAPEVLTNDQKEKIKKFSDLLYEIIIEKLQIGDYEEKMGQAHGYSGIMLALARYSDSVNDNKKKHIKNVIKTYLRKEKYLYIAMKEEIKDKWCNGLSGMIISRIEILKYINDTEIIDDLKLMINNLIKCQETMCNGDSLCHGNSGTIIAVKVCIENGYDTKGNLNDIFYKMLSQVLGEKIYTHDYKLLKTLTVDNPTLYTGSAGVGYMFLKSIADKIENNILTLS